MIFSTFMPQQYLQLSKKGKGETYWNISQVSVWTSVRTIFIGHQTNIFSYLPTHWIHAKYSICNRKTPLMQPPNKYSLQQTNRFYINYTKSINGSCKSRIRQMYNPKFLTLIQDYIISFYLYYTTAMIATIKQQITLKFKKFIMVFTIAILFEPIFHAFDSFSDTLRFGQHSSLVEKAAELYLLFLLLFYASSKAMNIIFIHNMMYAYLPQTLVLKYIFNKFFMEKAKERWIQIVQNIHQNQDLIFNTALYVFIFIVVTKSIRVLKVRKQTQAKGQEKEELEFQS